MYEIYTDGAVSGNGKENAPGGWAYVILKDGVLLKQNSGGEIGTTNQRMELLAAINACEDMENIDSFAEVKLYSDSAYFIRCFTENWWKNWESNGWRNSKKEPVANAELWRRLIPYFMKVPNYKFIKVRGHQTNNTESAHWNGVVDKMAVLAKERVKNG